MKIDQILTYYPEYKDVISSKVYEHGTKEGYNATWKKYSFYGNVFLAIFFHEHASNYSGITILSQSGGTYHDYAGYSIKNGFFGGEIKTSERDERNRSTCYADKKKWYHLKDFSKANNNCPVFYNFLHIDGIMYSYDVLKTKEPIWYLDKMNKFKGSNQNKLDMVGLLNKKDAMQYEFKNYHKIMSYLKANF